MQQISSLSEINTITKNYKQQNKTIGFVPTMGFLHEGHMSLIKEAKKQSDIVIVSIFVNPKQFGANEDLDKYPRDLKRDKKHCKTEDVDILFTPDKNDFYPNDFQTTLSVSKLTKDLCGASRPDHFDGVTTVVCKLFNVVRADIAFFGQKDFQQCLVIKQMVKDLYLPIEVKILPIIREEDGLALSSRNKYLSNEERKHALVLCKSLETAHELIISGEKNVLQIQKKIESLILSVPTRIDYIEIRNQKNLEKVNTIDEDIVIALAVYVGNTRLIDNILISV